MAMDIYNILKQYKEAKKKFLNENKINGKTIKKPNKQLAINWLNEKEKEAGKVNGYSEEAKIKYYKTLKKEITFLKTALYWFNDLDLDKLTKEQLEKKYEDIEKDNLLSVKGKKMAISYKKDYYDKVFKGGFFKFMNKHKIAKEVIKRKVYQEKDVRYFSFQTLKKIISKAKLNSHKLAFWLLFDTGIEVSALCQLRKNMFTIEQDKDKIDIKITVPKNISKFGRTTRHIWLWQEETKRLVINRLEEIDNNELLFDFTPPAIYKALKQITKPNKMLTEGEVFKPITIKDFRSSMACYLISLDVNEGEIKKRLGHKPSSTVIDSYVTYFAKGDKKALRKIKEIEQANYKEKLDQLTEQVNYLTRINKEHTERDKKHLDVIKKLEEIEKTLENKDGYIVMYQNGKTYYGQLEEETQEKKGVKKLRTPKVNAVKR